jgi:agmatinase
VIVGIPSDVGAGHRRGANLGPAALRARLLEDDPAFPQRSRDAGVVDLGDVFCVPQLLHDEMLSAAQLEASRLALYPHVAEDERAGFPVSPLSMAERALALVAASNPDAAVLVLGGDHSTAWPAVKALAAARSGLGIVHVDAHTDLLEERLGVRYCYGTWAFHANDLVGRGGRLVQVGIRASRHDRSHWEQSLAVRQLWAEEVRRAPEAAIDTVVEWLRHAGVSEVYFSNDVDGTDPAWAEATGTPEPGGLDPELVVALVRRLGRELRIAGGDVMEVAPELGGSAAARERTVALGARYLRETLAAALGEEL